MKRLLTAIACLLSVTAIAQQNYFTTSPAGYNATTLAFRSKAGVTDSLKSFVFQDQASGKYYSIFSGVKVQSLFDGLSSIYVPLTRLVSTGFGNLGGGNLGSNLTIRSDTSHNSSGLLTWNYGLRFATQANLGFANVLDYGAVNDSTVNSTTAFQNATNSGKPVYIPPGYYKLSTPVTYTGKVVWFGDGNKSVLKSDGDVIQVTNGTQSQFSNFRMENVSTPYIIRRDTTTFAVVYQGYSNGLGYQPTVNDADIWGSLTTSQQNQFINVGITFYGYSTDVNVWNITGRFASIAIGATSNSSIKDCTIQGGKGTFGAITMGNIFNTAQRSKGNIVSGNNVYYASYNGINFNGNDDGIASNNVSMYNGESGIKLFQNSFNGASAKNYRMVVSNNSVKNNYYDGLDLSTSNPRTGLDTVNHTVVGNKVVNNHGSGINSDGIGSTYTGNYITDNGSSGVDDYGSNNSFNSNYFRNNNKLNTPTGTHELSMAGGGFHSVISDNTFVRTSLYNGYAIYVTDSATVKNNTALKSTYFFGGAVKVYNNTYQTGSTNGEALFNVNVTAPAHVTTGGLSTQLVQGNGLLVNKSAITAGAVTNALTFNNGGAGDASGSTFDGSATKTLSYNSIGALANGTSAVNQNFNLGTGVGVLSGLSITGVQSASSWGVSGLQFKTVASTLTNTSTAASGTVAHTVGVSFGRPTLAATNTGVISTNASTLYIAGEPINGTNLTAGSQFALWAERGNVNFKGLSLAVGSGNGQNANIWSLMDNIKIGSALNISSNNNGGQNMYLNANVYYNTSGVETYTTTGAASRLFLSGTSMLFATASSGTAGTTATMATKWSLDASGNMLSTGSNTATSFITSGGTSGQIPTGTGTLITAGASTTVLHGGTTPSFSQIVNADITNATIDLTTKVTGLLPNGNIASATNWNTAYTQTRQWDGGSTGLVAATGRTSLGLGTLATQSGTFSGTSSGTNTGDETTSRINALYGYTPANGANYLPIASPVFTTSISGPLGNFGDGTYGIVNRKWTGGNAGAIYPSSVTASNTNYALYTDGNTTYLNAPTYSYLAVGANPIVQASSTGAAVTGSLAVSGATISTAYVTSGGTSSQYVKGDGTLGTAPISGTYTPTISNTTNIASSTPAQCNYTRVGNVVTVTGYITVTPTIAAGANAILNISLPIASNLANFYDLTGVGTGTSGSGLGNAAILSDSVNDKATLDFVTATTAVSGTIVFTFSYQVI